MPVVPLNAGFSNIADFVNSLFSPGVRSLATLQSAISSGTLSVEFSSESDKILDCWQAVWLPTQANAVSQQHCPREDQRLIQYLRDYIGSNGLAMFVPQLKLAGLLAGGPPIYELHGYSRFDFKAGGQWDAGVVRQFLKHFLLGAHFVAIHVPQDLPPGASPVTNLYYFFKGGPLKDLVRDDPADSHYASLTSLLGTYFPNTVSGQAKNPSPFVCACLVGPTIQGSDPVRDGNTFLQLEGWQESRIGPFPDPHGRHAADYQTYLGTLWNISTYGACAYSEKRASAIFLAPPSWPAKVNPTTYMPPYAGAYTLQKWLNTSLVKLCL
jgi:hypothetical protein